MNTPVDPLAVKIAQRLANIRNAERERIVVQNKLDDLLDQVSDLKEQLNRLDAIVTSTKYEITNCLNVPHDLTVVSSGE